MSVIVKETANVTVADAIKRQQKTETRRAFEYANIALAAGLPSATVVSYSQRSSMAVQSETVRLLSV
jgi:hypothetical protein